MSISSKRLSDAAAVRKYPSPFAIIISVMSLCIGTLSAGVGDYLSEPIADTPNDSYRELLTKKLISYGGDCGVMIIMPTGFGEWAVSASTVKRTAKHDTKAFSLCLTSAKSSLYESRFGSAKEVASVPVNKTCIGIDETFARAIQGAWRAILSMEAPPPSETELPVSLDGYVADFSVQMENGTVVTRRALNPTAPPASEIVTLGYTLRDYCLSSATQRMERRRDVIEKLNRFRDRCDQSKATSN